MIRPIIAFGSPEAQLIYTLFVNPDPLTVSPVQSPPQDYQLAELMLTITNSSGETFVLAEEGIQLSLPIGDDGASLAAPGGPWGEIGAYLTNNPGFDVVASFGTGSPPDAALWTIRPVDEVVSGGSPEEIDQIPAGTACVLQLSNVPVNTAVGTALVTVTENDAPPILFPVTKLESGFFFYGLVATDADGSPAAQVPYDTPVTLSWQSSVVDESAVAVYWSSNESPGGAATPTTYGSFVVPFNLTTNTVFTVVLTVEGDVPGQPPTQLALSTTVAVTTPDLVANDVTAQTLSVAGNAELGGALTVTSATCAVTIGTPEGNGYLGLLGTEQYPAMVVVDGTVNTGDLNAGGTLTVTGTLLAGPQPNWGDPTGLSVTGFLAMLQAPVTLQLPPFSGGGNTFNATTDGLLVGFIGGDLSGPPDSWGALTVTCTPPSGPQFGGTVSGQVSGGPVWDTLATSLVLPIPANSTFELQFWGGAYYVEPSCTVYFFPFGGGTANLQSPAPSVAATPATRPGPPPAAPKQEPGAREELVAVLAEILGQPIAGELRDRMLSALGRL